MSLHRVAAHWFVFAFTFTFACCCALALGACTQAKPERYHARGVVTALSGTPDDLVVTIHHEPIAAFKDRDGKVSPMRSMKMNWSCADPVLARQLVVGEKIAFDFEVRWESGMPLQLLKARRLAPDTKLLLAQ